jgi:7-carboxy-7-deazaguanine synthase
MTSERYAVNEVFETLQGEGLFTGTPSVFVRLQGCDVGCPWCDTKHTWRVQGENQISADAMFAKTENEPTFALMTASEIAFLVEHKFAAEHVVITGGEPCAHDLTALTKRLVANGRWPQIETSGTEKVRVDAAAFVTLSPKFKMPGGKELRADAFDRANEIKMPIGKESDVDLLQMLLDEHPPGAKPIWLQPLSQSPKATALCVAAATKYGWRVSLQAHKYAGLR